MGHLLALGTSGKLAACLSPRLLRANGNRTWMGRARRELLQADVSLAPGSSGGPLADAAGAVVGIASMVLGPGIAVAVPSHVVRRFVAQATGTRPSREGLV